MVIEKQQNKVTIAAEKEKLVDLPSRRCSAELVAIGIESDELVPHAQHASRVNQFELCCCHQTRMCFVMGLLFWKTLDSSLFRIWTHYGISLLSCVRFFGTAVYALMGCVKTSNVGTNHAVIKGNPIYLGQFGKQINEAELFDIMLLAEHYSEGVETVNIVYNYG